MAIFDIFNVSFLFSIGIIVILIGGIFTYVSYRMSEQDHKLSSMLGLVVSLANDLQQVKDKDKHVNLKQEETKDIQYASDMMGGQSMDDVINVSDGEYDDEELEDEDFEEVSENEVSEDDDDFGEEDNDLDYEQHKIKVLKLDLVNDENDMLELEADANAELEANAELNEETILIKNMYANMEAEAELLVEAEAKTEAEAKAETKVVEIELAAEDIEDIDNSIEDAIGTDYKKMSTNKLREVVVCKGLVPNASKLKKNELLKLLGDK
jgi:hypothetical protein